ncbi:MAG: phosphotransferase [Anaerolineaceae bacterium]|nr:phosphotransferase [Anaerolineaceae bacterium]
MLKFRYLFDNPDLARMLLKNWDYDENSEEMFQYFRISANAIYPLRIHGEVCYLRFSPVSEKRERNVMAELAFLDYLRGLGYPAMEAVKSRGGEEVVRKETPWGEFYASVFKRVAGEQINQTDFNDEIMFSYGSTLGELHAFSRQYANPSVKRWTHRDAFDWMEKTLSELGLDQEPMQELALLRREFDQLPITQDNYGLIHFDFEPDNVFYDETSQRCSVIDFDDTMYHWFVMDIVQALDAIQDEMEIDDCSHQETVFLKGYRSQFNIDEEVLSMRSVFRRFAGLYQFVRVARAMQERWENEPIWMVELREKLERLLIKSERNFGLNFGLETKSS